MRFSAVSTLAVALLASDAAAYGSSSYGRHWRWNSNKPDVKAVTTIVYEAPGSVPTTLVKKPKTTDCPFGNAPATETDAAKPPVVEYPVVETTAPVKEDEDDTTEETPSSGNLDSDQQKALDAHNAARKEVGTDPLVWDDALAKDAQEWAEHISSLGSLTHSDGSGQGENLYAGSYGSPYSTASDLWIDEKSQYSGQPIDGNFGQYGHYTQCVWSSTKKIGMGVAKGSDGMTYVVARYSPPGNMMGSTPY